MELKTGDCVEVRGPLEIVKTLDEEGTLGGLPFMPEMLEHCGKRFTVLRHAEKTCVELLGGSYAIREFINNDVVLLEGLRCPGSSHHGCQRMCVLFWKTAWLKRIEGLQSPVAPSARELEILSTRLKTKVSADRYFCQSSELSAATQKRRLGRMEILVKCWRDVRSGAVGTGEMLPLILVPLYRKVHDLLFGRPRLLGNLRKTPIGELHLQPDEMVEVRDLEEMRQTLDTRGRNRGLPCDIEMGRFCGKRYRVLSRLDRMISEATGEMRKVEGTVILDSNTCMCARVLGGCPRQEFTYWREVWLRRIDPEHTVALDERPALLGMERLRNLARDGGTPPPPLRLRLRPF
jgi:hypothetical protein